MASLKDWLEFISESDFGGVGVDLFSGTVDFWTGLAIMSEFRVSHVWLGLRLDIILTGVGVEIWLWRIFFDSALSWICLPNVNNRLPKDSFLWRLLKFRFRKLCSWSGWICDLNICCWRLCAFVSLNWLRFCRWWLDIACRSWICYWFLQVGWLLLGWVYDRLWFLLWFRFGLLLRLWVFWYFHEAKPQSVMNPCLIDRLLIDDWGFLFRLSCLLFILCLFGFL